MTPRIRVFHSPDPLGPAIDPADQLKDPEDQSNENGSNAPPPHATYREWIAATEIRALRRRLRLTQRQFAGWFGFSAATLRHWERGNRSPTGAALVLLTVIRENPRVVIQAVRKARMNARGALPEIEPLKSYRAPPGFGERPPPRRNRRR